MSFGIDFPWQHLTLRHPGHADQSVHGRRKAAMSKKASGSKVSQKRPKTIDDFRQAMSKIGYKLGDKNSKKGASLSFSVTGPDGKKVTMSSMDIARLIVTTKPVKTKAISPAIAKKPKKKKRNKRRTISQAANKLADKGYEMLGSAEYDKDWTPKYHIITPKGKRVAMTPDQISEIID